MSNYMGNPIPTEELTGMLAGIRQNLESTMRGSKFRVRVRRLIGQDCISVLHLASDSRDDWANGIVENDPGFMSFHITPTSPTEWVIESPIRHGNGLKANGISFRIIKADSPMGAAVKLCKWMAKNRDAIEVMSKLN